MTTGGTAGGGPAGGGPLRIGTAERTAAMKALDEHLAAGRLNVEEYADRSARAANATTTDDLTTLFTDLPAPHPPLPGLPAAPPPTAALPAVPGDALPAEPAGGLLGVWGPRLVAATPVIALALFFLTRSWLWFLLIPAMGALVYGGDRERRHHRGR